MKRIGARHPRARPAGDREDLGRAVGHGVPRADRDDALGADARPGDARGLDAAVREGARRRRRWRSSPTAQIEKLIYPVSFYRNKAVHVKATCRKLLAEFGGVVPSTMDELLTLPGVGRKTANLVRIVAHKRPDSICVDTHVHRIANRFGWVRTRTPEQTERALYEVTAKKWWSRINLYLVTWGQHVCKPVYPLCPRCPVLDLCPRIGVTRVGKSVESRHAHVARFRLPRSR